jgi:hypothetical protein
MKIEFVPHREQSELLLQTVTAECCTEKYWLFVVTTTCNTSALCGQSAELTILNLAVHTVTTGFQAGNRYADR